jgi:hypothetical protein
MRCQKSCIIHNRVHLFHTLQSIIYFQYVNSVLENATIANLARRLFNIR